MFKTILSVFASGFALLLAGGAAAATLPPEGEWRVEAVNGASLQHETTMNIRADGEAGGRGPCNSYGGAFVVEAGGVLRFRGPVSTQMYCHDSMDEEQAFFAALAAVRDVKIKGDAVSLLDASGEERVRLVKAPKLSLIGPWRVMGVNNQRGGVVSDANVEKLRVEFGQDGSISAFGGCKTIFGGYQLQGDRIQIEVVGVTKKHCGDAAPHERSFIAALENAAKIERLRHGALGFRDAGGATQFTMRPAAP